MAASSSTTRSPTTPRTPTPRGTRVELPRSQLPESSRARSNDTQAGSSRAQNEDVINGVAANAGPADQLDLILACLDRMEPAIALIEPMRAALTQLQSEVSNLQIQSAAETQAPLMKRARLIGNIIQYVLGGGAIPDGNGTPFCEALINVIRPRCDAVERAIYFNQILKRFPTTSVRGSTSSPWSNALCDIKRSVHRLISSENAKGKHPRLAIIRARLRAEFWGRHVPLLKPDVDDHALACLVICIYADVDNTGFWAHYDALFELNQAWVDIIVGERARHWNLAIEAEAKRHVYEYAEEMLRTDVPARRLRAAGGDEEDGDESKKRTRSPGAAAGACPHGGIPGVCDRCPDGRVSRSDESPRRCEHHGQERCVQCAPKGGSVETDDDN